RIHTLHADDAIEHALRMFRRDCLEYKIKAELGSRFFMPKLTGPPLGFPRVQIDPRPLGTLLHIAAGNMDILPAYSVAEGLLTGNINILKLPSVDNGITVALFELLLTIEPRLRDYVYISTRLPMTLLQSDVWLRLLTVLRSGAAKKRFPLSEGLHPQDAG
ncbi:MAG: hypothetical protein IKC40_03015, partial [Oscillospiraceae bacterium]|nr:hypothetical protein [Oscillospiraceae bacterium]